MPQANVSAPTNNQRESVEDSVSICAHYSSLHAAILTSSVSTAVLGLWCHPYITSLEFSHKSINWSKSVMLRLSVLYKCCFV